MKKLILLLMMSLSVLTFAQQSKDSINKLEKTDQVLSKILDKSLEVAEKTGNFIVEQAPDVLREFYIWHTAKHIFWIIFAIIFGLSFRYLPLCWLEDEKDHYNTINFFGKWGDEGGVTAWVYFCIGMLISFIIISYHVYDLIFILVSPKLYLIEYLLSLKQS